LLGEEHVVGVVGIFCLVMSGWRGVIPCGHYFGGLAQTMS
jgi:hypothetical protein